MTSKVSHSCQERTLARPVREQLDAFEKRERLLRAEERKQRAKQLKLPLDRSKGGPPHQPHFPRKLLTPGCEFGWATAHLPAAKLSLTI